jgi:tRNA (guanine37-N1)-methyltransferase
VPVEQWCVKVPKARGEEMRIALIKSGDLDRALKPRPEGEFLLLPVTRECAGACRAFFEPVLLPPELPRHELIGGIALMQEDDRDGAERLLASRPSLHTILLPLSSVEGEYRIRRFDVLAGRPTTRTRHIEYGHRFDIDLGVAYFSARLSNERQRILHQMEPGERVLDMFSGVGPFAIVLAERAETVFAVDINPAAVQLMITNIAMNKSKNVLPVLADASRLDRLGLQGFDRIVMNLPLGSPQFLEVAYRLCRDGGTIHFYVLQSEEGAYLPRIESLGCRNVTELMVRSYSPDQWHAVYDIEVG